MPKCFEGIENLTFTEPPDLIITEMNSNQGETIKFIKEINPLDKDHNPRGVEEWLNEIEKCMKSSLMYYLKETFLDL